MEVNHPLDWRDGQPWSSRFGDPYFSRASGLDETRHVFLRHNRLAERWHALAPQTRFVIGETGFGTGLNFLCAWQLWTECAPAHAHLHFVSVEKYPLTRDELARALALWPQLAPWRDALLAQYADLPPGWHRFTFDRVTLTIAVGDVADALEQLEFAADAWFLDGFAPARNPDMWSARVFAAMARHSHMGATFATYTAAGAVRRGLEAAGFDVTRAKGHGPKREMLHGQLRRAPTESWTAPWYARPPRSHDERRAIVLGGGLAGTGAAASLAARDWTVTLIERHAKLAAETSGNPQAILYARLASRATPLRELVIGGYSHTLRRLQGGLLDNEAWQRCGLLQLAFDDDEAARQDKLAAQDDLAALFRSVDSAEASALAGVNLPHGGLYFHSGGWVDPAALCRALADHPGITQRLACEALSLERAGDEWQVRSAQGLIASAPVVIVATGKDAAAFEALRHLPLRRIRGQLSCIPATAAGAALRAVVCGAGYIAPAVAGTHVLGATHKFNDDATDVRSAEHRENLDMLRTLAPALHQALEAETLDCGTLAGRAGIRVSTPDYLPLVGPVVDAAAFNARYAALRHDATLRIDAPAPWLPGLYVTTAHGSRGLISAPLAGEILAAYLEGEPAPLPTDVMHALHPSRFLLRALIRGEGGS